MHTLSVEEERTSDSLGGRGRCPPARKRLSKPQVLEVPEAQQVAFWRVTGLGHHMDISRDHSFVVDSSSQKKKVTPMLKALQSN